MKQVMSASIVVAAVLLVTPRLAAQVTGDEPIVVSDLGAGIYMLQARGGNIGLSVGPDATFMIDDQYAPLTDRIVAEVGKLTQRPIDFVLNTHWHGDHTGGNENLGAAGVWIVAHDKVRERMSAEQFLEIFGERVPAAPAVALPSITFSDSVRFHVNGEAIEVVHPDGAAHTDGDSVVFFEGANIVHAGDVFFNGMYPFIDVSTGGSLPGVVRAADRILERIDDDHEDHSGARAGVEPSGAPSLPGHDRRSRQGRRVDGGGRKHSRGGDRRQPHGAVGRHLRDGTLVHQSPGLRGYRLRQRRGRLGRSRRLSADT